MGDEGSLLVAFFFDGVEQMTNDSNPPGADTCE